MATTSKVLARTAAATTNTTLYTVPSATTTVVTDILISNTATSTSTVTINLNGTAALSATSIPANDSLSFSLKQVLSAAQTISGSASTTAVNFHVSGVEIA